MYTKEINERSPLRVFEKSIHGGLGKGNLGVVMSRAGVGKTALLIGIALDDLMRALWVRHGHPGIGVPEDAIEKLRYDLYYIKHLSIVFDLTIVIDTAKVIVSGKGAK